MIRLLAQSDPATKTQLVSSALWLWIGFAVLAVFLVGSAWVIVSRQRRMALRGRAKVKRRAIRDAWVEAGRRAEPIDDEPEIRG